MIHIKETEIIPFLKTAQTGYTKMISEGDLEMEVELAEKVEEALTQAMDIRRATQPNIRCGATA